MPAPITEILPIQVHFVRHDEELQQAAALRLQAYSRHLPGLPPEVGLPDALDRHPACKVLVAKDKSTGAVIGTMRLYLNLFGPLGVESACPLPEYITSSLSMEPTRLAVQASPLGTLAKTALFKALYLYCIQEGVEYVVAGARRPIDRMYEALHFKDVYEKGKTYPYAMNLPHRVLCAHMPSLEPQFDPGSAMYRFVKGTEHPDIDVTVKQRSASELLCA